MRSSFPPLSLAKTLLAGCIYALVVAHASAVPLLIVDTDYRTDVDDVGMLAMIHGAEDLGLAHTIGVIATTAGTSVVGAIDAVNTYYERANLPIGVIASGLASGGGDEYAPTLANTSLFPSDQTTATAPNSTALYRSLLNAAADGSVTIVVAGGQNGIYDLMQTGANHNGDGILLTGMQLIQAKVKELAIMGGNFVDPIYSESNIRRGITASQQVAANWPTPIVYSGWEIGESVRTGAALTNPAVNPVAKAYEVFSGSGPVGVIGNRDSWDQTAALYAITGLAFDGRALWSLSAPHTISFDSGGRTLKTPAAGSNRYYLIQQMSKGDLATVISDLMTGTTTPPPLPVGETMARYNFDEAAGAANPGNPILNYGSAGAALHLSGTGGPQGRDNTGAGGYGAAALPRFGTAFDVLASGTGTYHATATANGGGALSTNVVKQSELQGAAGSFTYEAIVKLSGITNEQNILAHDGDGTNRGFLFRVLGGKLAFYTGVTEFSATIPAAGAHGFVPGSWFHVAVSYTGAEGAADNLKFYWTSIGAVPSEANLIGAATLATDLDGSISNRLGIGTTTRSPFRFETAGLIDEVRLSSIVRETNDFDFLWGAPDTDSDGIPDDWEISRGLNPGSSNDLVDTDYDGVIDLMEYALGLNPAATNTTGLPAVTVEGGFLTLTLVRNPDAANLTYQAQVSGDLGAWLFGPDNVTILQDTPTLLKARDNIPVAASPKRYMRLKVTPRP